MQITNIEELKARKYIEVDLPGWDIDDVFTCKLQRVNLLDLAAKGKIPNPLIGNVVELFQGKGPQPDSDDGLKTLNELSELFAEVTMVEPTFAEVNEAIGLTDAQKMVIYNFALKGVSAIEPFRSKSKSIGTSEHGKDVSKDTKPNNENKG
ncbi:hypothetical protein [Clostridium gasigenes]|uniref:Phage XkdN-like tail assembly chaperone protein, TAC n=1 Tax=Clostridium gasigenes TaxID=94869 RepID=A0A1H0N6T5_9CLOT|nr:hypothetical protein [Clostridium gasigenes]MBB6623829.1 hypothetical protein [Clostridium gasigenes]MBU3131596.1 hypothetical protein [Clostridium gasigenes]SDO88205.1 hypothetical protein SAMN04488529_101707 [Clostridium gasigenes]